MKKRFLKTIVTTIIALAVVILTMPVSFALNSSYSGTAGDESYWYFDSATGIMTISGAGRIHDNWGDQDIYDGTDLALYIKEIVVQDGITELNYNIFQNHTSLEKIELPDSVVRIEDGAFENCTSLKSVKLPSSLEYIGEEAFKDCTSLTSLEIPDSVTKIDYRAFQGCTALSELSLPDNVTLNASLNDTALYDNPAYCENYAIYINNKLIETDYDNIPAEFTVKEGTHTIGLGAFVDCHSLVKVTLPESVTSIGEYAFADCYALEEINIPSGVTVIPESAFSACGKLTEITLPEGVTKIEDSAFSIEGGTLEKIYIPKSMKEIDEYAFLYCTVSDVYFGGSEEEWNNIAIEESGNETLLNATIHFNSTEGNAASGEAEGEENGSINPVIIGAAVVAAVVVIAGVVFFVLKKKKA